MDGYSGFPDSYSLAKHYPTIACEDDPRVEIADEGIDVAQRIIDLLTRFPQDFGISAQLLDDALAPLQPVLDELEVLLPAKRVLNHGFLVTPAQKAAMDANLARLRAMEAGQ